MRPWLHRLVIGSASELRRYKSFLLLVLLLIALDQVLSRVIPRGTAVSDLPSLSELGSRGADWLFGRLPGQAWDLLGRPWFFGALAGLFVLKQLSSLWPSSDLRRMHRREREAFGLLHSLLVLRWRQVGWDAAAIGVTCLVVGTWSGATYGLTRLGWQHDGSPAWAWAWVFLAAAVFPLWMAGLSFSSKLAVLSRGSAGERLALFLELFWRPHRLGPSWVFFAFRSLLEGLAVLAVPLAAVLLLSDAWLRVAVDAAIATPVYAYLKMLTFRYFLHVYRDAPLVRAEYPDYYRTAE